MSGLRGGIGVGPSINNKILRGGKGGGGGGGVVVDGHLKVGVKH